MGIGLEGMQSDVHDVIARPGQSHVQVRSVVGGEDAGEGIA